MNNKIKELAKKAGGNPNYKAFRGHPLPPPPDYIDPSTVDLEKFAELLVRECVDIANDTRYDGKVVANRIKFVFGVEE